MTADDTRHVTGSVVLVCAHCGRTFTPSHRPGPTPRYCRRSCRQRAYEARAVTTTNHDSAADTDPTVAVQHRLDAGISTSGRVHALHPDHPQPRADGTRPTLCGTTARPTTREFTRSPGACNRCLRSSPSRTTVDHVPASDLERLLTAARDASAALDRRHDELALQLVHTVLKVEGHLSRDKPPASSPHHLT
jgi:hypothetical protein